VQVLSERSDPSERVTVEGLQSLADAFLASADVVRVTEVGETRYSVRELVDKAREIVELGTRRAQQPIPSASEPSVAAALERRPRLSSEQREMVFRLVRDDEIMQS
jgi:hypothetical protein